MGDVRRRRGVRWLPFALALGVLGLPGARSARAQTPPVPPPPPPPSETPADGTGHEVRLEARIRQLEALIQKMPDPEYVRRLEASVKQLSGQVEQLSTRLEAAEAGRTNPTQGAAEPGTSPGGGAGTAGAGSETERERERTPGGAASPTGAAAEPPSPRFEMPEPIPNYPLKARFGPGFELKSDDNEFVLQFHNLTQADGRFYQQGNQSPVADTFVFPRQWFIFSGHLTKPYEYYASIAEAFDTMNILDVFLNVNFDKRAQFRIGRQKSPFTYEFFGEPVQALANGEWSLFFNNFGMNRDLGAMLWGESLLRRVDYAAGIFNSTPNSFLDLSDPKDLIAFLNVAPFRPDEGSPLENFNIGGSVVAGGEQRTPVPQTLRTIVPTSGNAALGVPFLAFNNNVVEAGHRALWSLHAAYFYRQLSLIGEWQSGFQDYALAVPSSSRTHLPVESFYVQAAYLLTGERAASRGLVKPIRPFDLRRGKRGVGAWELAARYNLLDLGHQVFTSGLADPNLWTDRLYTTDLAVSWYWNQYVRVLFDWQHAEFGSPVLYRPGGLQKNSDLFLIRFQVWF